MAQNKSLSTQEVADILHVSKSTIYELIRRGEINSYKVGRKVRFTQDDVAAYIARSRHEQSVHPVRRVEISSELLHPATGKGEKPFIISGQDVVLDILSNFLHQNGLGTDRCYLNSFEGLLALYEKKVDAAACHLYAVDEKSFNVPYVKRLMPGVKAVLINVSYRKQGYYVAAGNPKEIRGWREKLGRPVWIWTYPNKYGQMQLPNIPNGTPRAWAKYYKDVAPWIFGVYAESENDRFLYNALCYYVLGKVCWNVKTDGDALLEEFHRLMFGAAAKPMAALFDEIERKWVNEVAGRLVDTDLGPMRQPPSPYELFTRVYSPETLARWDARLNEAASRVAPGSLEARRIALFRREFLAPIGKENMP